MLAGSGEYELQLACLRHPLQAILRGSNRRAAQTERRLYDLGREVRFARRSKEKPGSVGAPRGQGRICSAMSEIPASKLVARAFVHSRSPGFVFRACIEFG